ncbi:uncharacterized protein HD556DRAFT_1373717 [Suillus plorans]|uniref:Uncharacterized protein n=1 Tax=Suillus plorans TaxID=116603 RepID=A0A9P7DI61_9AGAM|nr:uncharacterized protein HD556DRAFT_1373717 [Suillus plorans]KAG1793713.1 hypothetical protein HD556DRAFT_1373717 [Suillus plorans]
MRSKLFHSHCKVHLRLAELCFAVTVTRALGSISLHALPFHCTTFSRSIPRADNTTREVGSVFWNAPNDLLRGELNVRLEGDPSGSQWALTLVSLRWSAPSPDMQLEEVLLRAMVRVQSTN